MTQETTAVRFALDLMMGVFLLGMGCLVLGLAAAIVEQGPLLIARLGEWWRKPPIKDGETIASRLGKLHW